MRVSTSVIEEERLWFFFVMRFTRSVACDLGDLPTGRWSRWCKLRVWLGNHLFSAEIKRFVTKFATLLELRVPSCVLSSSAPVNSIRDVSEEGSLEFSQVLELR